MTPNSRLRDVASRAIALPRALRLAIACAAVFATTVALAQDAAPPAPATFAPVAPATRVAPAAKTPPVPLLWKVSDRDNALYLLGSFHLLKPDDYPLSPDIDTAFADAEKLVFELAPSEMSSPQLAMQMAQAAMRGDGTLLDSELPPALATAFRDWAAANAASLAASGMNAQALQMFEPWFAALLVSLTELGKQGLDPKLGLDAHMAARAATANKPAQGLETGAEQIAFLDGMARGEQLQFLQEALDQAQPGNDELRAMHDHWRRGDADALWTGMGQEMRREFPALYRRINVARNDAWVATLQQRLQKDGRDDTLVVVGALHLLGEDGVVEKLRAKGYAVERVCSACASP